MKSTTGEVEIALSIASQVSTVRNRERSGEIEVWVWNLEAINGEERIGREASRNAWVFG